MTSRAMAASFLVLALVCGSAVEAAAQEQSLQRAKDLYAEAAYEDALGILANLPGSESVTESARYRAACLIALGRLEEAQKSVAAIVASHPAYRPDPSDTSPRVLEMFRATRLELMPDIARRMYAEAKGAMDRKDASAAMQGFEALLDVIDDPELQAQTTFAELKLLASGFLQLTRAHAAEAAPTVPKAPQPVAAPPVVLQATPVAQELPPWVPPDSITQRSVYKGAVRIRIGEDGKVVSATIAEPVHPVYDGLLLAAARRWVYEPARQNGVPIASERTVQVVLKGR